MERCQFLVPNGSRGGAFVGYAPLWSYDIPPVPLQVGPPFENTLIGGLQLDVEPRSAQV